jgi:hypothetical protein
VNQTVSALISGGKGNVADLCRQICGYGKKIHRNSFPKADERLKELAAPNRQ